MMIELCSHMETCQDGNEAGGEGSLFDVSVGGRNSTVSRVDKEAARRCGRGRSAAKDTRLTYWGTGPRKPKCWLCLRLA